MFLVVFPVAGPRHLTHTSQQGPGLTLAGGQSEGRAGQDWEDFSITAAPLTIRQLTESLQADPVATDWPASSLVPSWSEHWVRTQRPQHSVLEGEKTSPSPHSPSHRVSDTEISASPSLSLQV